MLFLVLFIGLASLNAGLLAAHCGPRAALAGRGFWDSSPSACWRSSGCTSSSCACSSATSSLRREAEDDLRRQAHEFEQLYNRAPCGYHSLDANGRFVRINDTALGWLGYRRDEVIGRPFADFLSPASRQLFAGRFESFKQTGAVRDLEFELVKKTARCCASAQRRRPPRRGRPLPR